MKRFVICLAVTFGGALWFHVMTLNAMMELAAGIVWAVSPEKEEEKELFKYEGDRIEKVGSMWDAKDWDQCMAAIDDRNRRETKEVTEVELKSNFATDTYELVVKYEDGSVKIQPIDPMAIFEYGGVGKYLKDLERRLGLGFEIKTSL